jgi:bifunctional ADP-heptose synthase (sugar kinase/adenylyltransferase)
MPLSERMEIIASMACVDYVVPFSEDDPRQIIEALKPDLMVKGHEYDGVKIPCMDMVKTMFAPASPYPDRSASSTVAEICGAAL